MYPLDIQHSHGKCFVFRWFSQLETPIYFGDFPYVSHNQMVKSWWSRGENRRDCDFLNTFPHEKFWGLFSQKKTQKKCTKKNGWIPILNPHLCGELRSLHWNQPSGMSACWGERPPIDGHEKNWKKEMLSHSHGGLWSSSILVSTIREVYNRLPTIIYQSHSHMFDSSNPINVPR